MTYEPQRFDLSIPVRVNLSSDTQNQTIARNEGSDGIRRGRR